LQANAAVPSVDRDHSGKPSIFCRTPAELTSSSLSTQFHTTSRVKVLMRQCKL
jgi:hypothetical protein